ncbi:hypothetical protein MITS9509_01036 [Synechococcus sp. MIT S9509]|nr:hypothetical protein MITS9509_01036 [Synechococcus sp. MIT S9509]
MIHNLLFQRPAKRLSINKFRISPNPSSALNNNATLYQKLITTKFEYEVILLQRKVVGVQLQVQHLILKELKVRLVDNA